MNRFFLSVFFIAFLGESKRPKHDHGLGNLKSFIEHLHEEYDKPITTQVQLMSDEVYRKKHEMDQLVDSYKIEV